MKQKTKHTLIIVENLPVPMDRRVWQEAKTLKANGYDVSVICPKMRGCTKSYELLDGIEIYRHKIACEAAGILGFALEYATALFGEFLLAWRIWFRKRFDVIHICNPPDLLFLVALPFRMLFGVCVVYDVHDLCPEMFKAKFGNQRPLVNWAVRMAERLTLWNADIVLATNSSVKRRLVQRGKLNEEDAFVVRTSPTTMDTDFDPDPALRCGREHLVGYIGVMGNADGVDLLIEIAREVVHVAGRKDIQFLIMGTGPQYDNIKALRDRYDLADYVTMPGRVSDEYLGRALTTIDVGVACDPTNDYNNHCTMNKTLEYMMFGKPQVLFETVEGRFSAGDSAIYIQNNSVEDFAKAICYLADNPEERFDKGELGRARLHQFSWETSAASLVRAYNQCLCQPESQYKLEPACMEDAVNP